MYQTRTPEAGGGWDAPLQYAEMDPSGRYGRFKEVLGKGAMKTVYRAFDELLGIEVAWNQVKLHGVFETSEEMRRLYSEVQLLEDLDNASIMRFFTSWVDSDRRTFNFITEMFTSGTLRGYRKKYKNVNIRTIKDWARQILTGLEYLHGHDPPVIHRDLKCDNIFINGHLGQVKIGDLGLAAIIHGSQLAHSVIGTPEFMAPELYEEEYDELVDIYSFGMCVLEMVTREYPYSECTNPAQIYKKVTSGKLPAAYYRIDDEEARRFIGRCLEKASSRPSASELLKDPFLSVEQDDEDLPVPLLQMASLSLQAKKSHKTDKKTKMSITGTRNPEDDTIFLKVQISDKNGGGSRNIYFPFDITGDTPLDVASEMVKELDIADWEAAEIANMIHEEISNLIPSLKQLSPSGIHPQQRFDFADEDDSDDNSSQNPYYTSSSCSSSQASFASLFSPRDIQNCQGNSLRHWLQDKKTFSDNWNSESSTASGKHTNTNLYIRENNLDLRCIYQQEEIHRIQRAWKCKSIGGDSAERGRRSLTTESMLDLRSKLLHQKLVEEVTKRRSKTVGAVEDVGFSFQELSGALRRNPPGFKGGLI